MGFFPELACWMWMIVAMMLPVDLNAVRLTANRSLWRRRHRAIAGFLAGYLAPWIPPGLAVARLRQPTWTHTPLAAALCLAGAALWQRTPMHRRALAACHRSQPLAPVGWRADRDCLRFGGIIGAACLWGSWPLMLGCAFTGHSLIAMLSGMAIGFVERWSFAPRPRAVMAATLVLAGYYALMQERL
jgi:predicted metal-binding membrane protein